MKWTTDSNLTVSMAGLGAFVILLGAQLWYMAPGRGWAWLSAMGVMPLAALVLRFARRYYSGPETIRQLTNAALFAGVMVSAILLVKLVALMGGSPAFAAEWPQRSQGFFFGALVVAMSNGIPKQLGSARRQATRRIVGWAFVLGGLGFATAWLFVPLDRANVAAMALLMTGTAVATTRVLWCLVRGGGGRSVGAA